MRSFLFLFFISIFIISNSGFAQKRWIKPLNKKVTAKFTKEELIQKLNSNDEKEIEIALREIARLPDKSMTKYVIELLNKGLPDKLTELCLEVLGALADPSSLSILLSYANHRRADVRIIALQSLVSIQSSKYRADIVTALENGLRDSNSEVRETAASLIGEAKIKEAIPILFQAYDKGVREAAISIGKLGNRDDALRLAAYLGQRELDILLDAIREFLIRDDFPEEGKMDLLDKLMEIAGPQVREFLVSFVSEIEKNKKYKKIKEKAEEIIQAIPEQQ